MTTKNNPYIDLSGHDRSKDVEDMYSSRLEDIKNDPEFYAELVNDLMYHWLYGTRETPLMVLAKKNHLQYWADVIAKSDSYAVHSKEDEGDEYDHHYDSHDDRDYDNGYTHSQQSYSDRSDYARELYESGKIDRIQMAEMRMGA